MKLVNVTKNCVLAGEVNVAGTVVLRMRGLLGRQALPEGEALVIRPCDSIHTWFMRFPIDVVFVGRDGRVIKAYHALPPWRFSGIFFSSSYCAELPAGALKSTGTQAGDTVSLED